MRDGNTVELLTLEANQWISMDFHPVSVNSFHPHPTRFGGKPNPAQPNS
jgi:hypothetical protein